MKKTFIKILAGILLTVAARADTAFTIGANYSCFDLFTPYTPQPAVSASFNLNGVGAPGVFQSDVSGFYNYLPEKFYKYDYKIDLSAMAPAANHCVRLIVHFGNAINCGSPDTLSLNPAVSGNPAQILSAIEAPHGDVTFVFAGGCLEPGQPAVNFTMVSAIPWKTNFHSVTIIDDYYDPAGGPTNEARIDVQAVVPDIPPNWAYAPTPIPNVFYQGQMLFPTNFYNPSNQFQNVDFAMALLSGSNGVASSQMFTQTVQVAKSGLFNLPLPFDPISMGDGSVHWLSLAVRPTGSNTSFTTLSPPTPINATPQALYAYSAGVVADLTPGQAVTSLNGLADAVNLQAGNGIILGTNGNTLTITAQSGVPSDRDIKTDFAPVSAKNILARVSALPISSWRYTNEIANVRHVGPMAQDFRAAFSLGSGDKFIDFVDEEGVALSAIQGLNQKLEEQLKTKDAEIDELRARLDKLEKTMQQQQPDVNATTSPGTTR